MKFPDRWALTPDPQQLHLEQQRCVGRDDAAGASGAVAEIGRDRELADAADLHRGDAFVPALDHLPHADPELERLAAITRAVELAAVRQRADVVYGHGLARLRTGARPLLHILVLQAARGCCLHSCVSCLALAMKR